jgi:hypothetical protein
VIAGRHVQLRVVHRDEEQTVRGGAKFPVPYEKNGEEPNNAREADPEQSKIAPRNQAAKIQAARAAIGVSRECGDESGRGGHSRWCRLGVFKRRADALTELRECRLDRDGSIGPAEPASRKESPNQENGCDAGKNEQTRRADGRTENPEPIDGSQHPGEK